MSKNEKHVFLKPFTKIEILLHFIYYPNHMTIKHMISHLNKQDQAYILANKDLVQDIVEQKLDHEEIDALLATAHFVDAQKKKQQITMKLSQSTLEAIKLKARQEGIPYQTLIGSILHKYTTGQLSA
jgi:predicted DNA binding CopG/RHH family protein